MLQDFKRCRLEVEEALDFHKWLQTHSFDLGKPSIPWEQVSYRIIYNKYDPLSVAGPLAAGGRFNIGGAQAYPLFPDMNACLYSASSLECAKKEAGALLGYPRFFALKPYKVLHLWDLHFLIRNIFNYPELESHVKGDLIAAIWQYQKAPKISQILEPFLENMEEMGYYVLQLSTMGDRYWPFLLKMMTMLIAHLKQPRSPTLNTRKILIQNLWLGCMVFPFKWRTV